MFGPFEIFSTQFKEYIAYHSKYLVRTMQIVKDNLENAKCTLSIFQILILKVCPTLYLVSPFNLKRPH